ncbi:MAG: bacterioferritin [Bacteroidales bacterium]|nr:bacterioferritin [Bacteroidales bacterium]
MEPKYARSIELLNKAIAEENTASLQYMLFHFVCEDRGYRPLAMYFKKTAIEEMRHVEQLAERVLFLEGEVKMVLAKAVKNFDKVEDMLNYARQLEVETIETYNAWSKETADLGDAATHKMFQDLIVQEEGHMDQFRLEMDNMKEYGDKYLALQVVDNLKHQD